MSVRSRAYDLVLNGWELGSGSIRIHEPELQQRIFDLLGIAAEEADRRFGFFLTPVPLRRPAPRRLRLRHRPARRDPRRRGEHPGGHRLPEAPVGPRPDDRRRPRSTHAAARRAGHPHAAAEDLPRLTPRLTWADELTDRRRGRTLPTRRSRTKVVGMSDGGGAPRPWSPDPALWRR